MTTTQAPLKMRILLLAGGVALLRIVILALTPTDLFFDEAQYWAWSQNLDWGYFSKPPLIGWIIRLTTELGASDLPFWVRLSAPLLHSATAVVIGLWVEEAKPTAGIWAAAVYLSMPILAVGTWMISTDTVMAPFLAGALWAWWRHVESTRLWPAFVAGVLVGLAVMSKYAGAYFWLVVCATAVFGGHRPRPIGVLLAFVSFLLVIAPNMIWNLNHGFITFSHTADNASWDAGVRFNWASLASFSAAQVFVIGPLMFWVWMTALWFSTSRFERFLVWGSAPIVLLVCVQAFVSQAYANWAFAAYLCAAPLVAVRLVELRRFAVMGWGLLCNCLISAVVAVLLIAPNLNPNVSNRYMGREAAMQELVRIADGLPLAATDRQILADLTYVQQRNGAAGLVYALERHEPASNWYEMSAARPLSSATALVTEGEPSDMSFTCNSKPLRLMGITKPQTGAYKARVFAVYFVPAKCRPLEGSTGQT